MTLEQRSEFLITSAYRVSTRYGLAGDISGWDTSWDERHVDWSARLAAKIVEQYDAYRRSTDLRHVKGWYVEFLLHGFHMSRDSDNTGGNGQLHFIIRAIIIFLVIGVDLWKTHQEDPTISYGHKKFRSHWKPNWDLV